MNSNPLQMMIQMTQKQQQPQNPPIDPQRFCQMAPKLTKENLVQVLPSCCAINNTTTLTFQNAGSEAIFTNTNVVITKLA